MIVTLPGGGSVSLAAPLTRQLWLEQPPDIFEKRLRLHLVDAEGAGGNESRFHLLGDAPVL